MACVLPCYPQNAAEIATGVATPNMQFLWLDPQRYGAVGDGTTDDTTAMINWAAVVNASTTIRPVSIWPAGLTFVCGSPGLIISVNDFTLLANGSAIKVKATGWLANSIVLKVTGARSTLCYLTIDGNQGAFSAQVNPFILLNHSSTSDSKMVGCVVKNSVLVGYQTNSTIGYYEGCQFNSNANLGMQLETASYLHFTDCTFNQNGDGFHGMFNISGPVGSAFGVAIRHQSHHLTFEACEFNQNGLDGVTNGQGSYAVKFIACMAWQNNDGGFTMNHDTAGGMPPPPGDGLPPYDSEYIDCEAYNNWGSGLVANCSAVNITILGGRFYNNGRSAGVLAFGSNALNGIFFGGGSVGINVRTKAYDDRQLCKITAATGITTRVLTATNWAPGTMANYPRVALYDTSMIFQGFATISAESSGSVSITTAAQTPVPLTNVVSGWSVSQRLQFDGCFLDNNVQGQIDIDGFGFLPAALVSGYLGFKAISGATSSGQNVLLPGVTIQGPELLLNPSFEAGVTSWSVAGGTLTSYTTADQNLRSVGAAQFVGGVGTGTADSLLITNYKQFVQNAWIEASMWVSAVNPGDASITFFWDTAASLSTTVTHPGGGYKQLKIGAYVPTVGISTNIDLRLVVAAGKTAYFDQGSLQVKSLPYDNRDFAYPTRNLPV